MKLPSLPQISLPDLTGIPWGLVLRIASYLVVAIVVWMARGWHEDSVKLAELRGADKVAQAVRDRDSSIAAAVEGKLEAFRQQNVGVNRETLRIIERPVYRTDCIDDDGLRLLEQRAAASGATKPVAEVPAAPVAGGQDRR